MSNEKNFKFKLTPEQKEEVRKVTGKDAECIELSVQELEDRIAPVKVV